MDFCRNLFKGRVDRKNYFLGTIFLGLLFSVFFFDLAFLFGDNSISFGLCKIALAFFTGLFLAGLGVRRLHDAGITGWYVLLLFVPCVTVVAYFVIGIIKGNPAANEFGKPFSQNEKFWNMLCNTVPEDVAESNKNKPGASAGGDGAAAEHKTQ